MIRTTVTKIRKACASAIPRTGRVWRCDSQYTTGRLHKLLRRPERSPKDIEEECKKCKQLIDYIFGENTGVYGIHKSYLRTLPSYLQELHKVIIAIQNATQADLSFKHETEYEKCMRLIAEVFGKDDTVTSIGKVSQEPMKDINLKTSTAQQTEEQILQKIEVKTMNDLNLKATSAKRTEEQLAQKIEIIDETPLVEAEKPKIEGFNVNPKVLGSAPNVNIVKEDLRVQKYVCSSSPINENLKENINDADAMRKTIDALVRIIEKSRDFNEIENMSSTKNVTESTLTVSFASDDSTRQRKPGYSGEVDIQNPFDAMAKRCLNAPTNQLDKRLLKEMEKLGVPQTNQGRSRSAIEEKVVQMDVLKKPRKPVRETEIDLESRRIEHDSPLASVDSFPTFQSSNFSKSLSYCEFCALLKPERLPIHQLNSKPLPFNENDLELGQGPMDTSIDINHLHTEMKQYSNHNLKRLLLHEMKQLDIPLNDPPEQLLDDQRTGQNSKWKQTGNNLETISALFPAFQVASYPKNILDDEIDTCIKTERIMRHLDMQSLSIEEIEYDDIKHLKTLSENIKMVSDNECCRFDKMRYSKIPLKVKEFDSAVNVHNSNKEEVTDYKSTEQPPSQSFTAHFLNTKKLRSVIENEILVNNNVEGIQVNSENINNEHMPSQGAIDALSPAFQIANYPKNTSDYDLNTFYKPERTKMYEIKHTESIEKITDNENKCTEKEMEKQLNPIAQTIGKFAPQNEKSTFHYSNVPLPSKDNERIENVNSRESAGIESSIYNTQEAAKKAASPCTLHTERVIGKQEDKLPLNEKFENIGMGHINKLEKSGISNEQTDKRYWKKVSSLIYKLQPAFEKAHVNSSNNFENNVPFNEQSFAKNLDKSSMTNDKISLKYGKDELNYAPKSNEPISANKETDTQNWENKSSTATSVSGERQKVDVNHWNASERVTLFNEQFDNMKLENEKMELNHAKKSEKLYAKDEEDARNSKESFSMTYSIKPRSQNADVHYFKNSGTILPCNEQTNTQNFDKASMMDENNGQDNANDRISYANKSEQVISTDETCSQNWKKTMAFSKPKTKRTEMNYSNISENTENQQFDTHNWKTTSSVFYIKPDETKEHANKSEKLKNLSVNYMRKSEEFVPYNAQTGTNDWKELSSSYHSMKLDSEQTDLNYYKNKRDQNAPHNVQTDARNHIVTSDIKIKSEISQEQTHNRKDISTASYDKTNVESEKFAVNYATKFEHTTAPSDEQKQNWNQASGMAYNIRCEGENVNLNSNKSKENVPSSKQTNTYDWKEPSYGTNTETERAGVNYAKNCKETALSEEQKHSWNQASDMAYNIKLEGENVNLNSNKSEENVTSSKQANTYDWKEASSNTNMETEKCGMNYAFKFEESTPSQDQTHNWNVVLEMAHDIKSVNENDNLHSNEYKKNRPLGKQTNTEASSIPYNINTENEKNGLNYATKSEECTAFEEQTQNSDIASTLANNIEPEVIKVDFNNKKSEGNVHASKQTNAYDWEEAPSVKPEIDKMTTDHTKELKEEVTSNEQWDPYNQKSSSTAYNKPFSYMDINYTTQQSQLSDYPASAEKTNKSLTEQNNTSDIQGPHQYIKTKTATENQTKSTENIPLEPQPMEQNIYYDYYTYRDHQVNKMGNNIEFNRNSVDKQPETINKNADPNASDNEQIEVSHTFYSPTIPERKSNDPTPSEKNSPIPNSFTNTHTVMNPVVNKDTLSDPAGEKDGAPSTHSPLPELSLNDKLSRTEMMKRVRLRNQLEFCQAIERRFEPVEAKCGKKKSPCPPPAPKCPEPPPPPPPACPPPPPPCPKPCKPKCPPPCEPPKPTCPPPPPKCNPCKCSRPFSTFPIKSILTILLSQTSARYALSMPLLSLRPDPTDSVLSERIILFLHEMCMRMIAVNRRRMMHSQGEDDVTFALRSKGYEPWVPIPSWPVPKKEKPRPLVCPKEGCKVIPPPRLGDPCARDNPCLGFPKQRNFSLPNLCISYD